jgi:hypothetical protein
VVSRGPVFSCQETRSAFIVLSLSVEEEEMMRRDSGILGCCKRRLTDLTP